MADGEIASLGEVFQGADQRGPGQLRPGAKLAGRDGYGVVRARLGEGHEVQQQAG